MAANISYSPLRYPGGKTPLAGLLSEISVKNKLSNGVYIEPYAGGAGAALSLLMNGSFKRIHINDYDYHIYAMWFSILNNHREFCHLIEKTPVSVEEWYKQKEIYEKHKDADLLSSGFATFFLNRTNRSGIIFKAGPIGGFNQQGNYLIDARYNKKNLIERINLINSRRDFITLTNYDALYMLGNMESFYERHERSFTYLDPPYFNKGKFLYLNNYVYENHKALATAIKGLGSKKWLVSYDNSPEIIKFYDHFRMATFNLKYSLQTKRIDKELMVFSNSLVFNNEVFINNKKTVLNFI